ncbi:SWI/SNF chromatin-remodeling complex [Salix suchowensis]|nr:SWI/SNF chromatin-remodeling complex [Salix suchowensis]
MYPFEEAYNMNMKDQQRKAQLAARQTGAQQNHGMSPRQNQQNTPMAPLLLGRNHRDLLGVVASKPPDIQCTTHSNGGNAESRPANPYARNPQKFPTNLSSDSQQTPDVNVLDGTIKGRSRPNQIPKYYHHSLPGTAYAHTTSRPSATIAEKDRVCPTRAGDRHQWGRDLRIIEAEYATLHHRRPWRDINDWGIVDIEGLTMSIRSRLATEMSYALTTLTFLSTMRGQAPGSGFPIYQCTDLFEELLDLMEDIGFGEAMDGVNDELDDSSIITHRQLVNAYQEVQTEPFAVLHPKQGAKDYNLGPRPRSANLIITVMNIIRNLTTIADNLEYIARQDRLFDIMLRLCSVERSADGTLRASSPVLSIGDVIAIRKDTLYTLETAAYVTHFPTTMPPSKPTLRMANRVFDLISSYLVDPTEAMSPLACVQVAGTPANVRLGPPSLPDVALENVQKFLMVSHEYRQLFVICLRRIIETMKIVDDGEDLFDTTMSTTVPPLSFGMGFSEAGENASDRARVCLVATGHSMGYADGTGGGDGRADIQRTGEPRPR